MEDEEAFCRFEADAVVEKMAQQRLDDSSSASHNMSMDSTVSTFAGDFFLGGERREIMPPPPPLRSVVLNNEAEKQQQQKKPLPKPNIRMIDNTPDKMSASITTPANNVHFAEGS